MLTSFSVRSMEQAAKDLTLRTLEERALRAERAIAERISTCEAALHAAAGFVDNAWPISNEQWRLFVQPLRQHLISSGMQGMGFAGVVGPLEPASVDPPSIDRWAEPPMLEDRDLRTVILYLEPQDARNMRAMGFDMASEPRRRAAMERARDTGLTNISASVTIVQEMDTEAQRGFLMYVPLYARNRPVTTIQERRRALIGYAYSPFRAKDFLRNVLGRESEDVRIDVYDSDPRLPSESLYRQGTAEASDEGLSVARNLSVAGHEWTVQVTATPHMVGMHQAFPEWITWLVGTSSTALLCGLAFAMTRSQQMLRERVDVGECLIQHQRDAATMLENSMDAIIVIDDRDRILEWNKQAVNTFGWAKADALGRCLADLIVPVRMRAAHRRAIENVYTRQPTILGKRVDMPAVRRDGVEIVVALSIVSVTRQGETVFFASLRDITTRRQQETEIRQLNATLEQRVSERTQELEEAHQQLQAAYRDLEAFTRSVSHDLRAPLRAIRGYTSLIAQAHESSLSPRILRDLDTISNTAQRMNVILDNLFRLASVNQRELKTAEQSLGELVRRVLEEIHPDPKTHIHIAYEQLGCVCADPGMLALALHNLIDNAIKYSSTRPQPEIWIGAAERGQDRVGFVRDNGVGFDPRYADRLFGAFQRLHSDREFEGTGLGLTIVKSVIEKNRGRVWAESSRDGGATFYFALPACKFEAQINESQSVTPT